MFICTLIFLDDIQRFMLKGSRWYMIHTAWFLQILKSNNVVYQNGLVTEAAEIGSSLYLKDRVGQWIIYKYFYEYYLNLQTYLDIGKHIQLI